jgi:ABC-type multidrug transport system fused ATPase/permease subunit
MYGRVRKKRTEFAPIVVTVYAFLLSPYGMGYITYSIACAVVYSFVDHEFSYWSLERSYYQLQAAGITFILLPLLGVALYYMARAIDRWRAGIALKRSEKSASSESNPKSSDLDNRAHKLMQKMQIVKMKIYEEATEKDQARPQDSDVPVSGER